MSYKYTMETIFVLFGFGSFARAKHHRETVGFRNKDCNNCQLINVNDKDSYNDKHRALRVK